MARCVLLGMLFLGWSLAAAEAPAPANPPAQPAVNPAPAANTDDSNLVIAPKANAPAAQPAAMPAQGQAPAWASGPQPAQPADRKPGDPLMAGDGLILIAPKLIVAPAGGAQPEAAKPVVVPQGNPQPAAATNPSQPQQNGYNVPVLRLPIMFPSTTISSAGGPNMNFQVTGDATLETREIVAPLSIGSYYGPNIIPYKMPLAYGSPNNAQPAQKK